MLSQSTYTENMFIFLYFFDIIRKYVDFINHFQQYPRSRLQS